MGTYGIDGHIPVECWPGVAGRLTDAGICLETVYEEHGSVNLTCRRGRAHLNLAIKESSGTFHFMVFCWEMHYWVICLGDSHKAILTAAGSAPACRLPSHRPGGIALAAADAAPSASHPTGTASGPHSSDRPPTRTSR